MPRRSPRRFWLGFEAADAAAREGEDGVGVTLVHGGIGFDDTTGLGPKALIAAIPGGLGIAPAEAAGSARLPAGHRDLAIDVLLAAALVARPGGLFGARGPAARRPG